LPLPTQDDLVRLCQEPGLDYIAIRMNFPLYSATNGRLFVYECYQVKTLAVSVCAEASELIPGAWARTLNELKT